MYHIKLILMLIAGLGSCYLMVKAQELPPEPECVYVHAPWFDLEKQTRMALCGCEGRPVTIADITKLRRALAGAPLE